MATQISKIQQLKGELKLMADTLINYEKLLHADGKASTEDLKRLNKLKVSIKKIEAKIDPIKKNKGVVQQQPPKKLLKIIANDYAWTSHITGEVQWENQSKKIDINTLSDIPRFTIPWNTEGKLKLILSIKFQMEGVKREGYVQTRTIYSEFSVDENGKLKIDALNSISTTETGSSIIDIYSFFIEKRITQFKTMIEKRKEEEDSGWMESIEDCYETVKEYINPTTPIIDAIKDELKALTFSTDITATATPNGNDSSIEIKTMHEVTAKTIDLSASPYNVGAGIQFIIPGSKKTNNVATIRFEAEEIEKEIIHHETEVLFDKEGEFTLDSDDELALDKWWKSVEATLKSKLTAIERKKNTPQKDIESIVDDSINTILLGDQYTIKITGFASSTESEDKNNKLGYQRAASIKKYLVKTIKLDETRIRSTTDGKDTCKKNHGDNCSKQCRIGAVKFSLNSKKIK